MSLFKLIEGQSPLILSFPHSGTHIPADIALHLNETGQTMADTDWHVPRLYDFAQSMDVTWVEAQYSRYVVDLNRDPAGASLYPGQATTALCPAESFDGAPLWQMGQVPDEREVARRKDLYFTPYHRGLAAQIERTKDTHSFAVLYDCHSIRGAIPRLFDGDLPVLNLGTYEGRSCAPELQDVVGAAMAQGAQANVVNGRFKGGWITRNYGRPDENVHAIQMEIAQHAYMDETPPWQWREDRAQGLQKTLKDVLNSILKWAEGQ